ncbi:GyrI-like domain-containing protein [Actinoplanes sp. NPDC049316]|uniref:GyrI-like domain-containing protein n=1 Tax=Actinoplanes sp. NPDC049316 TaxID=3154727 RepID=UPI00342DA435
MAYRIEARELAEQATASVAASLPQTQVSSWLAGAFQEVIGYLGSARLEPAGPPYARFSFHDDVVEVEAGFPVAGPVLALGRVVPSSLPGGPAAVTTHRGRYEGLPVAYEAVAHWMKEHACEPSGPHWEVYYTDPRTEPDPARWRTDLIAPYRRG